MPFVETANLRVHHLLAGAADAPVIVLSNSLGTNLSMWDPQAPALEKKFRLLRYDTRGHGQSSVTPGPYTIELLAQDVVRLLDALRLERVHFCGLSMGGLIGMWLGAHAGQRLHKLVLCNTAPQIGTQEIWNARIETVRKAGMKAVAAAVIERWLTPEFRARSPEAAASAQQMLEAASPEGYAACCAAVRDADLREALASIGASTLVIAGGKDPVIPLRDARFIAGSIPGAQYAELDAAHLSNVEAPAQFNSELIRFLTV